MPPLTPLIVGTKRSWAPSGIAKKPMECTSCPYAPVGYGFVPDWVGKRAKVAFMLPFPTKDDVNAQRPFSGDMGNYILRHFLRPVGFSMDDIIVTYLLRCKPPWNARKRKQDYPTGKIRDVAETHCRIYDNRHGYEDQLLTPGLRDFDPNLFLITFEPLDVIKIPAYYRQIRRDMEKARYFVNEGFRPLVLMGNEPAELMAPFIVGKGSSKSWRGHFWEGEYKFKGKL